MKYLRIKYGGGFFLAVWLLMSPLPTEAGPPFITDDPEPVEYQHHEVIIASQEAQTHFGRNGFLTSLEYNYGVAPDLHLHIIAPYSFNIPTDGIIESGLGDVELGVKYRFIHETENRPMVGVLPLIETSTGDSKKGLGNGATQLFLPIWAQKRWGAWQTYGGGGYWINTAPNAINHWFFGWQLQKDISNRLTLGGEIFHATELTPGAGSSFGYNLGGIYNIDEQNYALFSAGRSLNNINVTNRFSAYAGYQLNF